MNDANAKKLYTDFPELYSQHTLPMNQTCMCWGFCCGDGWFDLIYKRPGRKIKDRPMPGIESISITSKGEMQSLRKVTLSWMCPSLEDLDDLTPYWLSPGISVWLDWGWGQINERVRL